jgi:probable rRNA maturation factor
MITLEPPRSLDGEATPWLKLGLSASGLARFVNRARAAVGLEGEVHVLLTGDATLRRLNRQFRGKNTATDVLSFPALQSGAGVAGDLAISLEAAERQAVRFGHSLRDEVRVLLLHGVLHLAGFDHETDSGEMAAREAQLRQELGLETSLIARATQTGIATKADSSAVLRNDKLENKQRRNAGVLRLRAARSAQDDRQKIFAQDDRLKKRVGA